MTFPNSRIWANITEDEKISRILELHDSASKNKKNRRPLTYLGYVTPWNQRGFSLALENAEKFSLISPVVYEALPEGLFIKFT